VLLGVSIRSVSAPLPVELTYFKGQAIKNGNQLLWQTASEINNKGFYIQRSKDGAKWQDLAFEAGKGTTLTAHNYEWVDDTPLLGHNYYRLKQVDNDGSFEFSPVILIIGAKNNNKTLVYPNPTSGDLFYESDDLKSVKRIQLYDVTGKLLQETTSINGKFSISHLPAGLYGFLMETTNGNVYERIVKQ
jgi:trimeric autotransporter adhesin